MIYNTIFLKVYSYWTKKDKKYHYVRKCNKHWWVWCNPKKRKKKEKTKQKQKTTNQKFNQTYKQTNKNNKCSVKSHSKTELLF